MFVCVCVYVPNFVCYRHLNREAGDSGCWAKVNRILMAAVKHSIWWQCDSLSGCHKFQTATLK